MAAAQQRQPRDVVEFPLNVAVTVALKYNQGRVVAGQYGERMLFTLTDNRVMFLDPDVAGQIEAAGINVRENFTLTQRWDGQKGSPRTWEVERVSGEQSDGTFAVPKLPPSASARAESSDHTELSKPMATAANSVSEVRRRQLGSAQSLLLSEANSLVDAYAMVLERALSKYQGRVKPDEARALLITAYIQRSKLSSVA